jgi:hypothetical protein
MLLTLFQDLEKQLQKFLPVVQDSQFSMLKLGVLLFRSLEY